MIKYPNEPEYAKQLLELALKRDKLIGKIEKTKNEKRRAKLEDELCDIEAAQKALLNKAVEVR